MQKSNKGNPLRQAPTRWLSTNKIKDETKELGLGRGRQTNKRSNHGAVKADKHHHPPWGREGRHHTHSNHGEGEAVNKGLGLGRGPRR